MAKYVWRVGSRVKINAQDAGKEIEKLRKSLDGIVRPEDIVGAAKDPGSTLHPHFEWNSHAAAEAWRRHQAVDLLGALMVVVLVKQNGEEISRPYRAYAVVTHASDIDDHEVYVFTTDAMNNPALRQQILSRALKEHESWERRYNELQEFSDIIQAAERTRQTLMPEAG